MIRFSIIILFLFSLKTYGQSKNYDTLDVANVFILYKKHDGTQHEFPFRTTDSTVYTIFGHPYDSIDCRGCGEYYAFHNINNEHSPFSQKQYIPDTNLVWYQALDTCYDTFRNFNIGFWSYKHIMELSGFGFNNRFFSLRSDSLVLNSQTSLEQFATYFPNSVHHKKDLTNYYQRRYARNGKCFPIGTTYSQVMLATNWCEPNSGIHCSSWKVIFKNDMLWRIYHDIGT